MWFADPNKGPQAGWLRLHSLTSCELWRLDVEVMVAAGVVSSEDIPPGSGVAASCFHTLSLCVSVS